MPDTDVGRTAVTDLTNQMVDASVDPQSTDGPTDQKETTYINADWSSQLGYYKKTPKLQSAINTKCSWTVGKGFEADEQTTIILNAIKGFGKDTFNSIIENMLRTKMIGGDSFAEIITDEEDILINLKPLDPGVIRTVVNRAGLIKRYEQINKESKSWVKRVLGKIMRKPAPLRFAPEKIFHLSRNRVADEIHGESVVPAVESIILNIKEAMEDWKKVLHRNVAPILVHHVDFDDPVKIAAYTAKVNESRKKFENIIVPKGTVEKIDVLTVAQNATLNPLPWIELNTQHFFQAVGVPDIVMGGGSVSLTDASSKIKYLAFEQLTREDQKETEEQILIQLNHVVTFEMPAKLENDMMSGKPNEKGAGSVAPPQAEPVQGPEQKDTTAEVKGKK